jgi:hypothetical protein
MLEQCLSPVASNPGAQLAAFMAGHALAGRDKLTLLAPTELAPLGDWIEQLVAESTGKRGVGIVPVAGEPLGGPDVYGDDRLFVHLRADGTHDAALARLADAGHPVLTLPLSARESIAGEMVRWEVAVPLAGALLEIDPFDQPNVQEAKDLTVEMLDRYAAAGELGDEERGSLEEVLGAAERGRSYVALQAFVEPDEEAAALLGRLQGRLRDALGCAVTAGFGPRYLHSTGQLHKGGAPVGVFIQLLAGEQDELEIPGRPFGFRTLRDAQALGDAGALRKRGLPLARLPLADAESAIDQALSREREAV